MLGLLRAEEKAINEAGNLRAKVDKALEILVRNATEEVGFAPRDVYSCVFLLESTKANHASVQRLTYLDFQQYIQAFSAEGGLPRASHLVVAMWPRKIGIHHVEWEINFKSDRIAKMAAAVMRSTENMHLQQTYSLLRKIPATSVMAGQFFEAFAHRMFSTRWESSQPPPQPTLMTSNEAIPPTFSTGPSCSPPQSPPPMPIRLARRDGVLVDLPDDLSQVTLSGDKYYTPVAPNNPLFDSFTIDHIPEDHTVILSIFQMTTSQKHGGSGKGYSYIQRIITHIRELLGGEDPTTAVKTVYFLVCPEGNSENHWTMPLGWQTRTTRSSNAEEKETHRGDVFCIRFPGTSCLLTPDSATQLNHGWVQVLITLETTRVGFNR